MIEFTFEKHRMINDNDTLTMMQYTLQVLTRHSEKKIFHSIISNQIARTISLLLEIIKCFILKYNIISVIHKSLVTNCHLLPVRLIIFVFKLLTNFYEFFFFSVGFASFRLQWITINVALVNSSKYLLFFIILLDSFLLLFCFVCLFT